MLDALKFAFEILVVGALALPWLAILSRMFASGPVSSLPSYLSVLPRPARGTVAVAVVIAFGYVGGSVVSRASRDLFNDELLEPLPTEARIRNAVYQDEYCGQDLIDLDEYLPFFDKTPPGKSPPTNKSSLSDKTSLSEIHLELRKELKNAFCPERLDANIQEQEREKRERKLEANIQEMFSLQEGELLLLGQDKVDRLKQYYDQITVLRGSALNGFILFMVCLFGYFGKFRARWSESRIFKFLTFLPAGFLLLYGSYSLVAHFHSLSLKAKDLLSGQGLDPTTQPIMAEVLERLYSDPPFAELVILLLGMVGLFVIPKAEQAASYFRTCVVAGIVTLICFGDGGGPRLYLQVVHSQIELHPATPTAAPGAAGTASQNGSENQKN
jgi:hypothetical protein